MDHDRLFKELLTAFFSEFLELFFPETAAALDRSSIEFLDKEVFSDLPIQRREADLVVCAKFRQQPSFFLIHVEHQAKAQAEFPRRMFAYFARLHEKFSLPVYPIALFSYEKPRRPEPQEYRLTISDLEVLTFRFRTVQLNQLDWRDFAQRRNPVAAAFLARMRGAARQTPAVLRHAYQQLLALRLSAARELLVENFLGAYLPLEDVQAFREELKQVPEKQRELIMGKAMGFMERGRLQEAQELVCRLLRKRLGSLDAATEARVTALSLSRLERLGEALLDFTAPADLEAWLKSQARK
jgi:hypothetical protein